MAARTTASKTGTAATAPRKAPAKTKAKAPAKSVVKQVSKPANRPANKAALAAKAKPTKPPKLKAKLVRDSFTMPQSDFDLIAALKARAINFKRPTKKSELLRAGLHALASLNSAALQAALNALTPLKPGRPRKENLA